MIQHYTGEEFEQEVLGCCGRGGWNGDYIPYRKSLALVKRFQPWNPAEPRPEVARALHASVALALNIEDWSELMLYTSINSPLDYYHGIDAFFEYKGRVVTLDVTINPHKGQYKADFTIYRKDVYFLDGGINQEGIRAIGNEIARWLSGGFLSHPVRRLW
ncbi:hypothetical protein MYX07_01300 [Patescibacteria group bacterium AH-259-L07]|nr:hypothetical protein [Patescibacteria group bacterium AH-259-L07]